jgi:hypothetical protein
MSTTRRAEGRTGAQAPLVAADLGLGTEVARGRWRDLDDGLRGQLCTLRAAPADEVDPLRTTEHLWIADGSTPVAYARLVRPPRSGGLVDHLAAVDEVRPLGLTSLLLADVVARYGAERLTVDAPPELVEFLVGIGFARPFADTRAPGEVAEAGGVTLHRAPEAPWR